LCHTNNLRRQIFPDLIQNIGFDSFKCIICGECETVLIRFSIRDKNIHKIELIPVITDDRGPQIGDPRLVNDKRGREIIEVLQKLSQSYGTKFSFKDWYGVVEK
jgi:hypothetical protein